MIRLFLSLVLIVVLVWASESFCTDRNRIVFVERACTRYKASDCDLVHAVVYRESTYRFDIVHEDVDNSIVRGAMMVKCETAREMGLKYGCEQLSQPMIGMRFGILYLEYQLKRYNNHRPSAVAAYNAGSAIKCENWNPGKCYPNEFINQKYVNDVMRHYWWLREWNPYNLKRD